MGDRTRQTKKSLRPHSSVSRAMVDQIESLIHGFDPDKGQRFSFRLVRFPFLTRDNAQKEIHGFTLAFLHTLQG